MTAPDPVGFLADATAPAINRVAARLAVRDLLAALGQDVSDPELAETPRRAVAAFEELLSKLARTTETFARGLQVQERLTTQLGAWLDDQLEPKGVGVVIEAEHLCMTMRGVQASGARTVTSSLHGLVRDDARTRAEFLALAHGR